MDLKKSWAEQFESSLRVYDYDDAVINYQYIAQHEFFRDQKDCQRKIKNQIREIIERIRYLLNRRNLDQIDAWIENYLKLDEAVSFVNRLGDASLNETVELVSNCQQFQRAQL